LVIAPGRDVVDVADFAERLRAWCMYDGRLVRSWRRNRVAVKTDSRAADSAVSK
jgi:hypothetical protein